MRNIVGPFRNNILCKYDLKGSVINRKTSFEMDNVQKIVMKDVNFDEIEKYLYLDRVDSERVINTATNDAYFLTDMNIMDYSLFVVKVSLPDKIVNFVLNGRLTLFLKKRKLINMN